MTRQVPIDARQLLRDLAPYGKPDTRRSVMEILVTAVPFLLLWALIHAALSRGICGSVFLLSL